ncbi:MAG TPA: hypothetical protein VE377_12905 [Candidatus Dormibacteraeota bacterium]|nr:hypothetical protein [Candidatus Dormibacteraeota bacterium]
MNDDFRKHLDLIQGVINRMAGNSFSVKTWAVGLITVLGGLAAKDSNPRLSCALLFPAICFWWMDAYYLRQEKLFRKLYVKVVDSDPKTKLYSLDTSPFSSEVMSLRKVAFSPTVRWLHFPILLFVIGLIVYSFGGFSRHHAPGSALPAPTVVSKPPSQ